MGRLFGTDGVRGVANADLTAELALGLSVAAAHVLAEAGTFEGHRPTAVVGRDPRASGEFLEAAVVAGLASAGVDVLRVGVLPTPAVAHLTGALGADLGVMLSASHNAMPDNGIKFFARGGHKLADELEDRIETVYEQHRTGAPWDRPTGAGVGRVTDYDEGFDRYVAHLVAVLPNRLDGLKVVLDEAHGAAARVSPEAFARAGAEVITIGAAPDGLNINDGCGSTHLGQLRAAVIEHGADFGIAHDGDADRCLAVDAAGEEIDGDQILAVLALAMREAGTLRGNTVVATVMSNLGFTLAMEREGLELVRTAVGDRYVLESMKEHGYALGGEQSGHVIVLDHATTGDGTLTGLMLAARVAATGRSLAELAAVMERLPQILINVPDVDKSRVHTSGELAAAVAEAERELGSTGRVLLRPSGTEPLVRVMVEAADIEQARSVAERLADAVKSALG
ncbi:MULTISPECIES: phosphoglucosamine mutase [Streptomyces]|uniref:Phosphoglucosamine mutase n=1 Tax=Streptomyces tsukubensis (strain DSM 42081 / NBRC 108919 / NRRL 18488 / 9993) TaxID=1114943 RepID=I2N4G8_STRT9|nr:phosphoglucosamine mutase [Streptomyces tsukubensis]MYS65092.1 phosphoglucosamine mutase [Streptomyces sp. SID5473]AZK95982.1 phosphoglucosamine mutase [Streptomyces tsukubensis]EIF91915.1 phosphoglucosamine mutase [Streptomyces tsukubensis NRRL18488]QKM67996.1 phosphoglucosamine mutase [Streptomyces tsukubensis NRRL18488]TAI44396.1 phosphoglucosamine mutase [Streptomyces tsukubensis]